MAHKNVVNGMWARVSDGAPTLSDGDALALQVDTSGALRLTSDAPVSIGQTRKGTLFGRPARYNENQLTLQDGDQAALQTDAGGNVIMTRL